MSHVGDITCYEDITCALDMEYTDTFHGMYRHASIFDLLDVVFDDG